MRAHRLKISVLIGIAGCLAAAPAFAECSDLPSWSQLKAALEAAVAAEPSGLNFDMWATIVDVDGTVCAVAFSGNAFTDQWLNSRVISAQKANTANGFSLSNPLSSSVFPHGLALSTANLYSPVQPGQSLFGLQHSNPVNPEVAYNGNSKHFGTSKDPMVGKRVGGVGLSGDTACADHNKAWRTRHNLNLDQLAGVGGVSGDPARPDNIIYSRSRRGAEWLQAPDVSEHRSQRRQLARRAMNAVSASNAARGQRCGACEVCEPATGTRIMTPPRR